MIKLFPILLFLSISFSLPIDFKHYTYLSYAAMCSYPEAQLAEWKCYWCPNATQNQHNVSVEEIFSDETLNVFGYILKTDEEIIVSFRGTQDESARNWILDFDVFLAEYSRCDGCKIHVGFKMCYESVQKKVVRGVQRIVESFPHLPVRVTGHSLGAALSILGAADLKDHGINVDLVVNFGQPRVGNRVFAHWYDQLGIKTYRAVNQKDIVPHLPPRFLDFFHIATEVWFL